MKQSLFKKLVTGALLLALPLVFNSCGNVDNPLEEIVNNASTPPVFMKFNPATQKWETIDLSKVDYTKLDETYVKNLIKEGELTLTPGKYLVQGNVTVNATITTDTDGALEFYLCDGARLLVNGRIVTGEQGGIEIYGQTENTGELSVKSEAEADAAVFVNKLTVEGGTFRAENTGGAAGMDIKDDATVRGGRVEAKGVACGIDVGGGEGKLTVTGSATVSVTATGADGGGNGHNGVNGDVILQATGNDNIQFVAAGGAGATPEQDGKACNNLFSQYWDEDKKSWQPGFGPNAFLSTSDDGVYWTEQTTPVSPGPVSYNTRFLSFLQRAFLEHF